MFTWLKDYIYFLYRCIILSFRGSKIFYAWMTVLTVLTLIGLNAYCKQLVGGLYLTGLTDHVSWGLYIANFTYLVGMAAAAVMLVIPVYVYKEKKLENVVIIGELFAIAAIIMCLLFVIVDLGRPDRFWHLIPGIGKFNWPVSMLSWDVVVLNIYLVLNLHVCGYLLYMKYLGRQPSKLFYMPFVFLSIVWAISIHTVTAFLFAGLGGRPFWNTAILGPRFIASAFASGPAFIVLTLQVIRKFTNYEVKEVTLLVLRKIIQVALIISVFLLLNEFFTEFYTDSLHVASMQYLFFGLHGYNGLVPWIWTAMVFNILALIIIVLPISKNIRYFNIACILMIIGIWIEKGMGLIIPGFIPTPLGEVVEYTPTFNEILVCIGIWAFGFLFYTILLKLAIPILKGDFNIDLEYAKIKKERGV
ncbi:Similar to sulfite reduction-associated complex DsrMKJOP protein DsrP [hydrothermal vent metagenome]|uniref:Similar to sulfite reduction-associated complex DsrMKJOP protein DsrP n=1 Tax=hydrothermal vent metagenome TaxID=652676 RepID=A0A3B1D057_9ZZZZ